MKKAKYSNIFLFISVFLIIFALFYREFLYTYRMALVDLVKYDHFQNHLIYLITGDESYKMGTPHGSRIIPILINWIIYEVAPCLKLTGINIDLSKVYVCATFATILSNYIFGFFLIFVVFAHLKFNLKLKDSECFLSLIITYGSLLSLGYFGLDRFVAFYVSLIIFFEKNFRTYIILILLSIFISEKIIIVFGFYYGLKFIFENDIKKRNLINIKYASICLLSLVLYFIYIYKLKDYIGYTFQQKSFLQMLIIEFSLKEFVISFIGDNFKSALSGGFLIFLFSVLPYLFLRLNDFENLNVKRYYISIPVFCFLLFSFFGGVENSSRYIAQFLIFWVPTLNRAVYKLIKNIY